MFNQTPSVTADAVREVLDKKSANDYCLLDVRQPGEYEQGHIPGAKLIPLGELVSRQSEISSGCETYVYCRSGNRSRAATSLLAGAGMTNVHNMLGGFDAWNGVEATGSPEFGAFCFPATLSAPELTAVAWLLEDGTQRFYRGVIDECKEVCSVIENLLKAEDAHKETLERLYEELSGQAPADGFPRSVVSPPGDEDLMEGCVSVDKALAWAKGKEVREVLELMMSLEANALDLYIKMARGVRDEGAKKVFGTLADEEQRHLESLGAELSKSY